MVLCSGNGTKGGEKKKSIVQLHDNTKMDSSICTLSSHIFYIYWHKDLKEESSFARKVKYNNIQPLQITEKA